MPDPRTASNWQTYIDTVLNLASAETDNPNKRVDADEVEKELQNYFYGIAYRRAHGIDCTDSNATNGISLNAQTNLTLYNAQSGQGIGENGNYAMIFDTTAANIWIAPLPADDELTFAPANLVLGNKAAGYNVAAFIDGLIIYTFERQPVWDKNSIDLDPTHVNHLSGQLIPHTTGAAPTIKTVVDDQITAFRNEHENAGAHTDGMLKSEYMEKATFVEEGGENLLRNPGMEWYPQGDVWTNAFHNLPQDWVLFNVPTAVGPETIIVRADDFSCRVVAGGADQGIQQSFANFARFQGRYVTAIVSLYTTVQNTVVIGIDDGVAPDFEAEDIPVTTWTRKPITFLMDAAASELTVIVKSTGACTFYIDEIVLCSGKVPSALVDSTDEMITQNTINQPAMNLSYNSVFDDWDNGAGVTTYPNLWLVGVGVPAVYQQAAGAGNFKFGTYSFELQLFNNDGVRSVLIPSSQLEQLIQQTDMVFSCWIKDTGAGSLDGIRIRASYGGVTPDVISDDIPVYSFANWTLVWLVIPQENDTLAAIHIENMAGTANSSRFYVDCCQLYMGNKPTEGILPSAWSHDIIHFNTAGASAGNAYLTFHDMVTGKPVTFPINSFTYSIAAEASGVGGGASMVELHVNLVFLAGWTVTLALVDTLYTYHSWDIMRTPTAQRRIWLYFNHVLASDCTNVAGYITYLKLQL